MMNLDHSSSRETFVRRERSKTENVAVSATKGYSSDEASLSGFEASLRSRGVIREVLPCKESRKRDEGGGRPRRGKDVG